MTNPLDTIELRRDAFIQKLSVQAQLIDNMMPLRASEITTTIATEEYRQIIEYALQALRQLKAVDVDGLKKPKRAECDPYHEGWNGCIDHLASRGLIRLEDADRQNALDKTIKKYEDEIMYLKSIKRTQFGEDSLRQYEIFVDELKTIRAALGGKDE